MATLEPTVFIVDDDDAVARGLRWLLETVHLPVQTYVSAREFLDTFDPSRPGCVLLDVRMPGMSGLELQQRLAARGGYHLPLIFVTGHGDVQMAVRTVQAGAFDFIEKPFNDQDLLERVQRAIACDAAEREREDQRRHLRDRFDALTPRERALLVLRHGLDGGAPRTLQQVGAALGISGERTRQLEARALDQLRAHPLVAALRDAIE